MIITIMIKIKMMIIILLHTNDPYTFRFAAARAPAGRPPRPRETSELSFKHTEHLTIVHFFFSNDIIRKGDPLKGKSEAKIATARAPAGRRLAPERRESFREGGYFINVIRKGSMHFIKVINLFELMLFEKVQ